MALGIGVNTAVFTAFNILQVTKSMLFGLRTIDPVTYIGVTSLLVLVALLACYIPARRATKVDPMVALRYE